MKVLHLSTSDLGGGAARAAYRLHQGLQNIHVDSQMLVQTRLSADKTVLAPGNAVTRTLNALRKPLSRLPLKLYPSQTAAEYSCAWLPDQWVSSIQRLNPDVINLHWVSDGFLQIEAIARLNKPIIWTLHDMWPFTGGCHYNQACDRYTQSCGQCPQLQSTQGLDLSRWQWQRKANAWRKCNLTIVSPSHWLAKCAAASSLFRDYRIEVIPNGLDISRYKPFNRTLTRDFLNLPQDKYLLLFGSVNSTSSLRKGFQLLQPALQRLSSYGWQEKVELVVFGSSQPDNPPDLGFKAHYLGSFSDDLSLALLYASVDIFLAPSLQDNLPNTVMEALACGTPCVAFNIGGMPDMIDHQKNGYLAPAFDADQFARGIAWTLENSERHQDLCNAARAKVEQEFCLKLQARQYELLYDSLLDERNPKN